MNRGCARRVGSVGRAELVLFWRDRMAVINALLPPIALVPMLSVTGIDTGGLSAHGFAVTGLLGLVLLSAVYYSLVNTYVARREGLVLKRLRVGEISDGELLAGTASPALATVVAQVVLSVVAGAVFLGLPVPVNAPVLAVGVFGGVAVFALLAAASSVFTRTVEMAQVTTLPAVGVCLVGSGLVIPLSALPGPVADVARFLPLTSALDLMRLGWLGTTAGAAPEDFVGVLGAAASPALALAAWGAVGVLAVRHWFRWEPRR